MILWIVNEDFKGKILTVSIKVSFEPKGTDEYYVRKWGIILNNGETLYQIEYKYFVENPKHDSSNSKTYFIFLD